MSFEQEKIKISDLESAIIFHKRTLLLLEEELIQTSDILIKLCKNHIFVKDTESYDHSSHYECSRCGFYR
jgi:hypothetical protein